MHYAQWAAGTALIGGNKNVEMCSAYILLSLYPVPSKKWEDQRNWLYLGLAIRYDFFIHSVVVVIDIGTVSALQRGDRHQLACSHICETAQRKPRQGNAQSHASVVELL